MAGRTFELVAHQVLVTHGSTSRDLRPIFKPPCPNCAAACWPNQPLAELTWFRVGGPAQALFMPEDEDDLAYFLAHLPAEIPVTVVGLGSNLIVRDGGVPGVVVRLGRGFNEITVEGDTACAPARRCPT